jgi:hypothetical protein
MTLRWCSDTTSIRKMLRMLSEIVIPQNIEERELLTLLTDCQTEAEYAAYQLAHPRHSMFYPEFKELANALEALRIDYHKKSLAFRKCRIKKRNQPS